MAKKPKVLVLFDVGEPTSLDDDYTEDLKSEDWKTERHVLRALRALPQSLLEPIQFHSTSICHLR